LKSKLEKKAVQESGVDTVIVRHCERLDELADCVALQKEVWNFSDLELVPLRMFVVARKVGGQVIGAFQGSDLIGFVLSIPGLRNGRPYLHSHMLAVRGDHRDCGLGQRLKLFQRDDALERGIELIEWTFDPLEIKNAYFNIERLGAIVRRYTVNQYGITSSPLQGGLPSDRLNAEWWLRSRRVQSAISGGPPRSFSPELEIDVPAEIYSWKASQESRPRAATVQQKNRETFLRAFADGLVVLGYQRGPGGNGRFLLGRWDEDFSL
jgi:predicted GNAT superfamily acetyltransferase